MHVLRDVFREKNQRSAGLPLITPSVVVMVVRLFRADWLGRRPQLLLLLASIRVDVGVDAGGVAAEWNYWSFASKMKMLLPSSVQHIIRSHLSLLRKRRGFTFFDVW